MSDIILSVKDLQVNYGGIEAVKGISFDVPAGDIVTLIGANGAGKSTTLKAIAGLVKPRSGSIVFEGTNITGKDSSDIVAKGVTLVPEGRRVFSNMTVLENIRIGAYLRKDNLEGDIAWVYDLFPRLKERAWQLAGTLSGGEQQMLAIGRALMSQPKLLLLDEPTKGLDPFFKIALAKIFDRLKAEGMTLFMVSHDVEFCAQYGDRCAMFFDGEVASQGSAREFFAGNNFYTTTANRIVRQWNSSLVTWEEVAAWAEQNMIPSEERQ